MGNINTYALPIMKGILGLEDDSEDADCLEFLRAIVPVIDISLKEGFAVTVTSGSYALLPAPVATSAFWGVLALGGQKLYKEKEFSDYLKELEGMTTISDSVTSMSRAENIRAMREEIASLRSEFKGALFQLALAGIDNAGAWSYQEVEIREDADDIG